VPRWRIIYGWLLATMAIWLVLDSIEALLWAEVLPWVPSGSAWDVPWMLAPMMLVVVARVGLPDGDAGLDSTGAEAVPRRAHGRLSAGGPLILTAMLVPLLHFAAYRAGIFDTSMREAHESLAFALIVVLGSLVFFYQRSLERRARRLESERRAALAQVEHQACHDPLTGLPNRRLLDDRLSQALALAARRRERLAVLFFDLDNFKRINDSFGHAFGDGLLRRIGERLASQVRSSDTLARIGGDEFVVVAGHIESRQSAERLTAKFLETLNEPIEHDGRAFPVRASAGIAIFPDDGADPIELLRRADAAMYQSKLASPGDQPPE